MIKASEKMLEIAKAEKVELAVMMDVSAACGSQVIYSGNRFAENKIYQIGAGVCAAQLIRSGIKVISQRDYASLEILYAKIDTSHSINQEAKDHHHPDNCGRSRAWLGRDTGCKHGQQRCACRTYAHANEQE